LGATTTAIAGLALSSWSERARAGAAPTTRNLILVHASGGWDPTHALDPKPGLSTVDVPPGDVEMFGDLPIFTDPSRPGVADFFSAWGSVTAVVNGFDVRSIVHPYCLRRAITGSAVDDTPDLGAIAGYELGRELPAPCLVLNATGYPGGYGAICVQTGFTNQLKALLDDSDAYPTTTFFPDAADADGIRRCVNARAQRERATRGSGASNRRRLDEFLASLGSGDVLRSASGQLGARGVALSTSEQLRVATDAIQSGLSFSVLVGDHPGIYEWDTHDDNAPQNQYHDQLFQTLRALCDDLALRPGKSAGSKMLDDTVVFVFSEMSRTPKRNAAGGKDHWPIGSAMIFGAGVAGGRAYGATDDQLGSRPIDLATGTVDDAGVAPLADHVVAGLLELIGVDPAGYLPNVAPLRGFIA
jgi:hypothetical protein